MHFAGYLAAAVCRRSNIIYRFVFLQHYSKLQLRTSGGPQAVVVVAVVGMGHMPGIKKYWKDSIDVAKLSE